MNPSSYLLDFFDKTYIINLPERLDRRKDMEFQLRRLGGDEALERVCFFPAIKPVDKGDFPSIGARGCFMSHLEVLRDAKHHNLKRILIMEDDLSFSRFLLDKEDLVVKELQETNWDFAYLGHQIDDVVAEKPNLSHIFQSYSQGIRLTHFFAVNQTSILLLVDFLEAILQRPAGFPEGGPMHVDGAYSTFRQKICK